MRKNRFDPEDERHVAIHANPTGIDRATRRATGYHKPVGPMADTNGLPRYVNRKGMLAVFGDMKTRRARKARARVKRAFARIGEVHA